MPDGFAWNGKTFESLSQVAFAITGTKWNGPRFFGLRGRPAPEHLTRYLLFKILAYKIQADRFGDLDADTLKVLDRAGGSDGSLRLSPRSSPRWTRGVLRRRRGLSWSVNGTENLTGSW